MTRAERKAVKIQTVKGGSTANTAFVEIDFKGRMEELLGRKGLRNATVRVKLVPASGRATVITEEGPSDAPEKGRRGSKGPFEIVREGDTMLLLVRRLPAGITRVKVNAGVRGARSRKSSRSTVLDTEAELDFIVVLTDGALAEVQDALSRANYRVFNTMDKIGLAKTALKEAEGRKQKRERRARLAKLKRRLAEQNAVRDALTARIEIVDSWLTILERALDAVSKRECEDGVDNGDPEDSIADFGTEGGDPGCIMRLDNDERDVAMPLRCPAPGQTVNAVGTISTPQTNVIERFVLYKLNPDPPLTIQPLVDAPVTQASDGPFAFPDDLCGQSTSVTYAYRVDPAGGGQQTLTVAVAAQSPANNTQPSGQDVSLRLAAGTTR